jgi:hypothetical protein
MLAVLVAQLLVTALAGATPLRGAAFPGVSLAAALPPAAVLTAWGLRHVPRLVAGVLVALTLGTSAWIVAGDHAEGWLGVRTSIPWGPLRYVFPRFDGPPAWPLIFCGLLAAGAAALIWRERRHAGEWRRAAARTRTSRVLH